MAESIKPGPNAALNRGHPFAQGLCAYWPFTEGAGKRPTEFVTGWGPSSVSANAPTHWMVGLPGVTYNTTASDLSGGNVTLQYRTPLVNGISSCTVGMLVVFNPYVPYTARPIICGGIEARISAGGNIDAQCRFDFINSTSYARPNIGQFGSGTDLRTVFCTRVSGAVPNVLTGLWPNSPLAAPTYFDRGGAAGTIGAATCSILGCDAGGTAWGPATVYWLGIWNRVLARDEMNSLHADPWQMIVPPLPYTLFVPVGGWASRVQFGGSPSARVVA